MPRVERKKSATDMYHIMLRGINQQVIFHDAEDYEKFLEILAECKAISEYKLFAYCLMGNHVHLLMKTGKEDLSQIFKRIGVRYVYWYNEKYCRRGHLFQDRFKSEVVEDDRCFLTVLRYIHQNPANAGITKNIGEYQWSSYKTYFNKNNKLIDGELAKDLLGKKFIAFNDEKNEDKCMEHDDSPFRLSDSEAKVIIKQMSGCDNVEDFLRLGNETRATHILKFKKMGMSIRQISRLTGVSFGVVRAIK